MSLFFRIATGHGYDKLPVFCTLAKTSDQVLNEDIFCEGSLR
jgi:hypothetical protein